MTPNKIDPIELNYISTTSQLIPVLALALVIELRYLITRPAQKLTKLEGIAFPISISALLIMGYCEFVLVDSLRVGYLTHDIKTLATVGISLSIVVLIYTPLGIMFKYISDSKTK